MIKFVCNKCSFETDSYKVSKYNKEVIPSNWLTLSGATFHNDKDEPKGLIYGGGMNLHFCSNRCLTEYLIGKPEENINNAMAQT